MMLTFDETGNSFINIFGNDVIVAPRPVPREYDRPFSTRTDNREIGNPSLISLFSIVLSKGDSQKKKLMSHFSGYLFFRSVGKRQPSTRPSFTAPQRSHRVACYGPRELAFWSTFPMQILIEMSGLI